VTPIPLGSFPFGVAVDPQGSRVYVGHSGGSVSVVDAATATPLDVIPSVGWGPFGLTVHPTAPELWVAAEDMFHVAVVDTGNLTSTKTVAVADGPAAFGTFIAAPAPDEGCADGLGAAVESALGKVEGAIRQNLHDNFSVPGATPAARLGRLTQGVKQLNRGHLMGVYQNLLGPQAAGMADPEPCDESLKLAVQQALATLEGALQGIDKNFQLPGNGLVSRLHNVADALARLEHGRLQGLYGNLL
jgi:YVTN family beta-propeller protein